jgi:EAL domain-containing protein (putative c-di-GMP-specific phosphodiesterase class I)
MRWAVKVAAMSTAPVGTGHSIAPPLTDPRWKVAFQRVIDDPALLVLYAQPIVELTSGAVAGYEMLSRFTGSWQSAPDVWFAAAEQWGYNATLQARVLRAAIAARASLPPDTFLTVNVDPHLLGDPQIVAALTDTADLSRLVLELTEHTQSQSQSGASAVIAQVREAGGMLAMDDAGTGYAGLSQLLHLRPDIVKLDRDLITGIDRDPVKAALLEVFGDLAGRMDTWILAEGIETTAELDTVIALGVPLGQGWALARAAPTMLEALEPAAVDHIRATAARSSLGDYVASLVKPVPVQLDPLASLISLNNDGQPRWVRADELDEWSPAMSVSPSTSVVDAARRAMTRPARHRYTPLVCTDGQGKVIGTVGVDDLLSALCTSYTTHNAR